MIDPPQLKLASRHAFSRALLASAREDHSAPGAAQRALQGLAIGAGVSAVGVVAKAGSTSKWAGLLVVKWLGLGVLAGVTTLVSVDYVVRPNAPLPSAAAANAGRASIGAGRVAQPAQPTQPTLEAPALVEPLQAAPATPSLAVAPTVPTANGDPAPDPVRALRRIRALLAAHSPERALTLLDAFDREQRGSPLTEEATVLRIDALVDLGHGEARQLGAEFLRDYPHSAYAQRVRAKLELP